LQSGLEANLELCARACPIYLWKFQSIFRRKSLVGHQTERFLTIDETCDLVITILNGKIVEGKLRLLPICHALIL